jgi:hypothetical protein
MSRKTDEAVQLVRDAIPESRTHDYKRQFYGAGEDQAHELLKDVSAFANTIGGQIIIGIDDKAGTLKIIGVDKDLVEAESRRMSQILRSGLEPRLDAQIEPFELDGKTLVSVSVPASHLAPHRVKNGNKSFFYYRTNTISESMDIYQIRDAFSRTRGLLDNARAFRNNRLSAFDEKDSPVIATGALKFVVHLSSLRSSDEIFYTRPQDFPAEISLNYLGGSSVLPRHFNALGACYFQPTPPEKLLRYVQVFRNGSIELIHSMHRTNPDRISSETIESRLVQPTFDCCSYLENLVPAPYVVQLSLIGCRGLEVTQITQYNYSGEFAVDKVLCPEVILNEVLEDVELLKKELTHALDFSMQAAGFDNFSGLDANGNWIHYQRR